MNPLLTIVGMGPGIGQGVAEKFGAEGYTVAMIARNEEKLRSFQAELQTKGIRCEYFLADAGDAAALQQAFANIRQALGDTDVLLYNAAVLKRTNLLDETMDSLAADFNVNVGGALEAVKAVLPAMQAQGEGTILLTGGGLSLNPSPLYGSLSIGKAGIRSLAGSLFAQLKNSPIKVSTVTVAGLVRPQSERHNPTAIAGEFWKLHRMPKEELKFEVVY
jgi:short-subunit dehydrogenase